MKTVNKVLKIRQLIVTLFIILFFSSSVVSNPFLSSFDNFLNNTILPLNKRSYYQKIFSKDEQKSLAKADKKRLQAEKFLVKYDENNKLYLQHLNYIKTTKDAKKIKQATKKASKYQKKSLKFGFKGLDIMFESNKTTYTIYNKKLSSFPKDTVLTKYKDSLLMLYTLKNDSAAMMKISAATLQETAKYNKLDSAYRKQTEAIKIQELAFGLYYDDKIVIDTVKKLYTKKVQIVKKTISANKNYPNLYVSKSDTIFSLTGLKPSEKNDIKTIKANTEESLIYNQNAAIFHDKAEQNKLLATNELNFVKRNKLTDEAKKAETSYYQNKIAEIENNIASNNLLYDLYTKKANEIRPKDSTLILKQGLESENFANKYYIYSEVLYDEAEDNNVLENKYLDLMKVNNFKLVALQHFENAFCKYLGLKTTEVIDNYSFIQDKIVTEIYTDTTKIADNTKKIEDKKNTDIKKDDKKNTDIKKDDKKNTDIKKDDKKIAVKDTTKSQYIYESSWFYTKENPDLQKIVAKKGVYFKVQCGIVKDLLPIKDYQNYEPITVDKFKDNDFIRILVGEYQTVEGAEYALSKLKKTFPDAYIVGYVDGTRDFYSNAKLKMKKTDDYEQIVTAEKAKIDGETYVAKKAEPVAKSDEYIVGKDVATLTATSYLIQLGTYSKPKTSEDLKGLKNIYTLETKNGLTRYMLGVYDTKDVADKKLIEVKNLGFEDAYVTAFKNGTEILVSETKTEKATEKVVEKTAETEGKISYKVQLGAYVLEMTDKEFFEKFPTLKGKYTVSHYTTVDNLIGYTVGSCANFDDVNKLMTELSDIGIADKFIVAFNGTKRITIAEAKKLTEK